MTTQERMIGTHGVSIVNLHLNFISNILLPLPLFIVEMWLHCLCGLQMIRLEAGRSCQNVLSMPKRNGESWLDIDYLWRIEAYFLLMRTWVWHLWLGSTCQTTDLPCFWEYKSYGYERLRMTTGPSRGISLAVEGGSDVGVNSTFLRQTQASPGWIYSTSLLCTPAGPLVHNNETTAFMTDWEGTEVASCRDEGMLFTLGCCQTTAKFITSSQGPLGPSHSVTLMNGFAN